MNIIEAPSPNFDARTAPPEILVLHYTGMRTGPEAPAPGDLRSLGLVLAAGVGACLLNPYFLFVFTLPPDLWAAVSDSSLRQDEMFASLFQSPLTSAYFTRAGGGLTTCRSRAHLPATAACHQCVSAPHRPRGLVLPGPR